jgi:AcrR family transcriptional regulator
MNVPDPALSKPAGRYHHGALREALLRAADLILAEHGPEGLSIRACARLVGVASSAVFRHFPNQRALMTAYAAEGWNRLGAAIAAAQAAAPPDPAARFGAVGRGYVAFALAEPNRFRVMFRHGLLDRGDAALLAAEARVESMLDAALASVLPPDATAADRRRKAALAWALAHGLAGLLLDGPLAEGQDAAARDALVRDVIAAAGPVFGAPPG